MLALSLLQSTMRKFLKVIHSLKSYWGKKKWRNLCWGLSRLINCWRLILAECMLSLLNPFSWSSTLRSKLRLLSILIRTKSKESSWLTTLDITLSASWRINWLLCQRRLSVLLFWWIVKVLLRICWCKMSTGLLNKFFWEAIKLEASMRTLPT